MVIYVSKKKREKKVKKHYFREYLYNLNSIKKSVIDICK